MVFGALGALILEVIKYLFSRNIEDYKTKLILKGKILDLKLNCLSALIDHKYRFFPKFDSPEKEWEEAQEEIIDNFGKTEEDVTLMCRKYLSILKEADQRMIEKLTDIASTGKFENMDAMGDAVYSETGRKYADEYFDILKSLINSLRIELNI